MQVVEGAEEEFMGKSNGGPAGMGGNVHEVDENPHGNAQE